jgi:hypothetical protein
MAYDAQAFDFHTTFPLIATSKSIAISAPRENASEVHVIVRGKRMQDGYWIFQITIGQLRRYVQIHVEDKDAAAREARRLYPLASDIQSNGATPLET